MPQLIKIAVIEDDEMVRSALSRLCSASGLEPTAFVSAEEFIAHPEKSLFSCVITDHQLPGMSGFDLAQYLYANSFGLPIIMITAQDHRRIENKCYQLQITLLKKPFDASVLLNAIRDALS